MKHLNLLIIALAALFATYACDSPKESVVASSDPTAPVIMQPQSGAEFIVTEDALEDTLIVLEWQEPDFGFQSAPEYSIQMLLPELEVDDILVLGTTNQTRFTILANDINNRLLQEGARPGESNAVRFQVQATLSDSLAKPVSEPVDVAIQPVLIEIEFPEIFVPGAYQSAAFFGSDWTPADAPPLASENSDGVFEGFIPLLSESDNVEFKFTEEPNWDRDYGDTGQDRTLDLRGDNIVAESGFSWISVDLNSGEFSVTRTEWSLIGDAANGFQDGDDVEMTYLPEEKVWTVTLDLTPGAFKFRANKDWDINFGDDQANGTLEFGGANIEVEEAGNFTVQMDLSNPPRFTFTITKN